MRTEELANRLEIAAAVVDQGGTAEDVLRRVHTGARRARLRRVGVTAGALAAVVAVAVAGVVASPEAAVELNPQLIVERTEGTGSARVFATSTGGPEAQTMTIDGIVDFARDRSRLAMSTSAQHPFVGGPSIDLLIVEDEMFTRPEGSTRWLRQAGTRWQQVFRDPAEGLGEFGRSDSRLERVGREMVRGVDTDHYSLANGAYDVWIDDAGRLRRMSVKPPAESVPGPLFEYVIEYFDFGVDTSAIEAPRAAEIASSPEELIDPAMRQQAEEITARAQRRIDAGEDPQVVWREAAEELKRLGVAVAGDR